MRTFGTTLVIAGVLAAMVPATMSEAASDGMTLVFSDEFAGNAEIDTASWRVYKGDGCPQLCGFGNNELQQYTGDTRNLRIEDGVLIIEAHRREDYTSAKVTTEAMPGWTYGKISVRARLPKGLGTWPAIWMLPDSNEFGGWPKSGEIDIMEHVGFNEAVVHGTIHTEAYNGMLGTQNTGTMRVEDATSAFHVYTVEWTKETLRWFIDDTEYHVIERKDSDTYKEWPFDKPFHLILNLAVGGDWGGREGVDEDAFPARFEIDWVRVWQ